MHHRCESPRSTYFADYGGRGISVCLEWFNFWAFLKDMGPTYQAGLEIERRDNDAGYFPENCYWGTDEQQANNKRNSHWITTPWGRLTIPQASRASGIGTAAIRKRLKLGWSAEHLFIAPSPLPLSKRLMGREVAMDIAANNLRLATTPPA